ncbi:hypothetical protein D3C80_908140 [compost metagenome]
MRRFPRRQHCHQGNQGRCQQVPGGRHLVAGQLDQPGGNEGRRATEQCVGDIETEGKAAEPHTGREYFREKARQGTVVHRQHGTEDDLDHQDDHQRLVIEHAEQGECQQQKQHRRHQQHGLAAEVVGKLAHQEDQADISRQRDGRGNEGVVLAHAHFSRQIRRHIAEQQIERHGIEAGDADANDDAAPVHGQQLADRRRCGAFLVLKALFHLQELGRVLQAHADVTPDQAKRRRQQERQAPAPILQRLGTQQRMQPGHERGAEQQAGGGTGRYDTGVEPALALWRIFGEERRGAGIFAGSGKTLDQTNEQQQRRCPQADVPVAGQDADAEGRDRHDQDRPTQGVTTPVFVTEMPPYQPAQWADDEGQGEHREGGQQTGGLVGLREERGSDDRGQVTVGGVVEPFDEVTHEAGAGRLAQGPALGVLLACLKLR